MGHFIAILSRDGNRFHIGDPLVGPETLTREQLIERYTFTGFYMPIATGKGTSPSPANSTHK